MHNCIFTAHCLESICDQSCPILAETSYLLERNGLQFNNEIFQKENRSISDSQIQQLLDSATGQCRSYICADTVAVSSAITYYAICHNWTGSRLHCDVYQLKFGNFVAMSKQGWSSKQEPQELEYMRIWMDSAKILIISNIDYVNFGDFECQTLLSTIQNRRSAAKSTIIVSPPPQQLVGKSLFFNRVLDLIKPRKLGGDIR